MMTSSGLRIYPNANDRIKWYGDSPDIGHPMCFCSYKSCLKVITEEDFGLRIFQTYAYAGLRIEARFHVRCWNEVSPNKFDLHLADSSDYPEDVP